MAQVNSFGLIADKLKPRLRNPPVRGIGDKHVTGMHHVWTTDLRACVEHGKCLEGLRLRRKVEL